MRPCEEGKPCIYEVFDYGNNQSVCGIDYDGDACPYIKPWGKRKYERDHAFRQAEKKPTVEAESTLGAWEDRQVLSAEDAGIEELQSARCSVCGRYLTTPYTYTFNKYNYCPHCGVPMDAERKEE